MMKKHGHIYETNKQRMKRWKAEGVLTEKLNASSRKAILMQKVEAILKSTVAFYEQKFYERLHPDYHYKDN